MMEYVYYAYVVKSEYHNYPYKFHCKDLNQKLHQHNSGLTVSIRFYIPFS
jgi:putative endonuclease